MSEEKPKTPAAAPKAGGGPGILGILLPAIVAGAASFGGAKVAGGAHHSAAAPSAEHAEKPPGPTLVLDPFLFTIPDTAKKAHPMKVTLGIEFDPTAKEAHSEEGFKGLIPRIRDSTLGYFRTLSYEDVLDAGATDKMRTEILARIQASGAPAAQRVLITDLVVQ